MARPRIRRAVLGIGLGLGSVGLLLGLWFFWLAGSLHLLASSLVTLAAAEWARRAWKLPTA